MTVMLRVNVGKVAFPIETNQDLKDAVNAIRDPVNRGVVVAILINEYMFPAAKMTVLEKRVGQNKLDTAREIESRSDSTNDDLGDFEYDLEFVQGLFNHNLRAIQEENRSYNYRFKAYHEKGCLNTTIWTGGPYFKVTSFKKVITTLMRAISHGATFRVILS